MLALKVSYSNLAEADEGQQDECKALKKEGKWQNEGVKQRCCK